MNARLLLLGVVTLSTGVGYVLLERATDVWPAIMVLVLGGGVAGAVHPTALSLGCGPIAGAVGTLVMYPFLDLDEQPVNLGLPVYVLVSAVFGCAGIPSAALGIQLGRRRHRRHA